MGEKLKYYQRISEAQSSGGRVWSFIFDGMSKFRTRLPILSNMAQMGEQFDNDVMGCIFHNDKRTQLYVAGPSAPCGVSYMIHCVHAEIERCIDAGIPLPEKIYVHVDGASDNTAHAFMAAMEHLVGSGLCQILEVWRLPVGHTHEVIYPFLVLKNPYLIFYPFLQLLQDIDGRFGVLSVHLRQQSIETPQKFLAQAKAAFIGPCETTYVAAGFNYKDYYDVLIDNHIKVKKSEFTNLGFRIERLTEEEKRNNPHMLQTKLNYRKHGQDVGVLLRPLNPLYNGVSESKAEVFYPVIVQSNWIPQGSYYPEDQAIGIQYMTSWPTGTPKPQEIVPWSNDYRKFMLAMRRKYPLSSDEHIFDAWKDHIREHLPITPNSEPPVPSDSIYDYIEGHGSSFKPPLSKYLYGSSPMGFEHLHPTGWQSSSNTPTVSPSLDTAFEGEYDSRQSWVDQLIKSVVQQHHQTIPHMLNRHPFKRWVFDCPEMNQGVIVHVKTQDPVTKTYSYPLMPGRIVAFCNDDVNEAPVFKVRPILDVKYP